jgi:hypothetical protein
MLARGAAVDADEFQRAICEFVDNNLIKIEGGRTSMKYLRNRIKNYFDLDFIADVDRCLVAMRIDPAALYLTGVELVNDSYSAFFRSKLGDYGCNCDVNMLYVSLLHQYSIDPKSLSVDKFKTILIEYGFELYNDDYILGYSFVGYI